MEYGILEVDKRDFGLYLIYSSRKSGVGKMNGTAIS
jgi:hypothetical protein